MRFLILACLLLFTGTAQVAHAEASWWNQDFAFRKAITVDGSAKGGNLSASVGRTPLLIRLHSGNFQFDGVSETGADIRFIAADDKTPLNYQIESFDPVLGVALIWVDVPDVGSSQQSIWMYYGDKKATDGGKGAAVFDADYSIVYHFDEAPGTPPHDATAYGNNVQAGSVATIDGIIGKAARLDGSTPMVLPGSVSLNTTEGGAFTFSAWLKVDALADGRSAIYARRQNGKSLVIALEKGVPVVEVSGTTTVRSNAGDAIKPGQWTHLAVTAADGKFVVYVDGRQYATMDAALPAFTSSAVLGGDVAPEAGATAPVDAASAFVGQMDEVRLSRVARTPVLIAVDAMAQGAESKLVQYGQDEKQAGMGFGYFGIIVKSVTADAWVIIGILLVMAVISWVVMWQRAVYVGTVTRANEAFVAVFRSAGKNMLALSREPEGSATIAPLRSSSLFRLYQVGAKEVWSRRDEQGHASIAAESIEAIRATMDSVLVRENQKLSRSMVLLTIAISGGPFLGLLGTVVGVMITFAAIAAAGDVNVNAIAPGIAAALLATVAGLFVAIPALFGYNYLLIRNKNVTANMQVFVDEFVTRLAELHRSADQPVLA
ncbi:outer membrane transport energization protein ExbB [Luteibacter rhizovicinus]|uniref:Outer membrane transport energization protein ExbB n=1 Tax=Luteibacter rhizovicinus TaxID=242606 RepID=A0A4V6P421_9GAMM|nr:MotA/TolQ/ExbB proton channel family protein [Luteibacter rhizovicinus]TCV91779.1 outer membrane transport energization protein ExbB [Luteibacter rhizovicinus]